MAEMLSDLARLRRETRVQEQLFETLLREKSSASTEELEELADALQTEEHRQASLHLVGLKGISERLKVYRERSDDSRARSMVRIAEEIFDIFGSWLELFQNTRLRILQLASARDPHPLSPVFTNGNEAVAYLDRLMK
jgi:hypothetical protein